MRRACSASERHAQLLECFRVLVIAVDVLQKLDQFGEGRRVKAAVLREAVFGSVAKLIEGPSGFRYSDHRDGEIAALNHFLQ